MRVVHDKAIKYCIDINRQTAQRKEVIMKTWFITGASTGLGREYTLAALNRGDRVAAASIDPENMEDYREKYGDQVLVQYLDVTDRNMVMKVFAEAAEYFGHIDICVNNAGYMQCGAIEEMSEEEARRIFDCNFFGTLFVSQAAAEHMRARRSGTIVQTTSLSTVDTIAGEGMYGATKHAVYGMSQAFYHELKDLGVRVIIVQPGPIKTNMAKRAKLCAKRIDDYKNVLAAETERWSNEDDHTADTGDPAKCAQALLKVVDADNPPRHIVLTTFGYKILKMSIEARLKEAEEWKELSFSADI